MIYVRIKDNGNQPNNLATRMDKINLSQVQKSLKWVRAGKGAGTNFTNIQFSSGTTQGREEVYQLIDESILNNN